MSALVTLTPARIARIRRLTANNNHMAAYAAGAQELGLSNLEQEFRTIDARIQTVGYLPSELRNKRDGLYDELMAAAKVQMTPKGYESFYASF